MVPGSSAHPLQCTDFEDRLILGWVHLPPEQNITADGSRKHPRLLSRVGHFTFDLERSRLVGQLAENGTQQG